MSRTAPSHLPTDIDRKRYPGVMRTHKTLSDGSRRTYFYHRPSGLRLHSPLGSEDFDIEYQQAVQRRFRSTKRKGGRGRTPSEVFVPFPTNVYFVRAEVTGLIKIGKADSIRRRMSVLRAAGPDRLTLIGSIVDPAGLLERRLHAAFAAERVHGEWFRPSERLEHFVAAHPIPK